MSFNVKVSKIYDDYRLVYELNPPCTVADIIRNLPSNITMVLIGRGYSVNPFLGLNKCGKYSDIEEYFDCEVDTNYLFELGSTIYIRLLADIDNGIPYTPIPHSVFLGPGDIVSTLQDRDSRYYVLGSNAYFNSNSDDIEDLHRYRLYNTETGDILENQDQDCLILVEKNCSEDFLKTIYLKIGRSREYYE